MTRKRIGIDLDSTLNTLDREWTAAISEAFNVVRTRADMTSWDCTSWTPPGCTDIFEPLKRPGWFRGLGVQPHAQEVVEALAEHYDLYIVTAYTAESCVDKRDWVREHFPMIPAHNIIFCNDKFLLEGLDYLIDDGPHNIEAFPNEGIVIDAPWNAHLGSQYPRVRNWDQVWTFFNKELTQDGARQNRLQPV